CEKFHFQLICQTTFPFCTPYGCSTVLRIPERHRGLDDATFSLISLPRPSIDGHHRSRPTCRYWLTLPPQTSHVSTLRPLVCISSSKLLSRLLIAALGFATLTKPATANHPHPPSFPKAYHML
ncbi:hypothetical protein FRC02_005961, partial [Tulasnella sp. 418]